MRDEEQARVQLVEVCHRLYARGWVANHDGNVSVRVNEKRILTTPTAVSKGDVRPEMLIVVEPCGKLIEGTRKAFSELSLHLKIYRERPDVGAVVHAHPVTACGFAVAGIELEPACMPEAVVSIGPRIPLAPLALPFGDEGAAALDGLTQDYDAAILANHGVFTWADDLWTAFYRLELVEHLAKIQLVARQIGEVRYLSDSQLATLLERRSKAGLGPEGRRRKASEGNLEAGASGWTPASSAPALPEGAATSAWTGVYPIAPCSGERPNPPPLGTFPSDPVPRASSAPAGAPPRELATDSSSRPSAEALQALIARELERVLGRK